MPKLKGLDDKTTTWIIEKIHEYFPQAKIYFFGSRVNGHPKKYSDLDVAIDNGARLDLAQWSLLEEAFSESDLAIMVDISDWHLVTKEFQEHIAKTGIVAE